MSAHSHFPCHKRSSNGRCNTLCERALDKPKHKRRLADTWSRDKTCVCESRGTHAREREGQTVWDHIQQQHTHTHTPHTHKTLSPWEPTTTTLASSALLSSMANTRTASATRVVRPTCGCELALYSVFCVTQVKCRESLTEPRLLSLSLFFSLSACDHATARGYHWGWRSADAGH